jgi:hypothetical protein
VLCRAWSVSCCGPSHELTSPECAEISPIWFVPTAQSVSCPRRPSNGLGREGSPAHPTRWIRLGDQRRQPAPNTRCQGHCRDASGRGSLTRTAKMRPRSRFCNYLGRPTPTSSSTGHPTCETDASPFRNQVKDLPAGLIRLGTCRCSLVPHVHDPVGYGQRHVARPRLRSRSHGRPGARP